MLLFAPAGTLHWPVRVALRALPVGRPDRDRDEKGHRLVVRNGKAKARTITTGAGPIEVEAQRVNDKARRTFAASSRNDGSARSDRPEGIHFRQRPVGGNACAHELGLQQLSRDLTDSARTTEDPRESR